MIVFASEQLWPNLSGLLHWHRQEGGVNALHIYHTADQPRSGRPAARLAQLCRKMFPQIEVVRLDKPGGITPQEVESQLCAWRRERGPGWRWVINATGGLKMMFAGGMTCVGEENCQVIYRELSGQWYELGRKAGAGGICAQEFHIPPEETDSIPVADLVKMQFDAPAGTGWDISEPKPLPVAEITKQGIAYDWDWHKAFSQAGEKPVEPHGILFEQYVAATLLLLGLKNFSVNLELRGEPGPTNGGEKEKTPLNEIDIVANHNGRLLIFDCKLRSGDQEKETALTDQIARAAELQRKLGGLGAQCVLVRPNWPFTKLHRAYAQASNLKVLDPEDAPHFFTRLGEILDLSLPDELINAQGYIKTAHEQGRLIFNQPTRLPGQENGIRNAKGGRSEREEFLWNVDSAVQRKMDENSQDWFCLHWRGKLILTWKPSVPEKTAVQKLETACSEFCTITIQKSRKGCTLYITMQYKDPPGKMQSQAVDFFANYRGKHLLDDRPDRRSH